MIRRAELGKLISDPDNEMLGKAFANRMWAHFFGRGFVNPVDDFGPHNPAKRSGAARQARRGVQEERLRRQEAMPLDHGQPRLPAQQHQHEDER